MKKMLSLREIKRKKIAANFSHITGDIGSQCD